jgi:hypothetical protein
LQIFREAPFGIHENAFIAESCIEWFRKDRKSSEEFRRLFSNYAGEHFEKTLVLVKLIVVDFGPFERGFHGIGKRAKSGRPGRGHWEELGGWGKDWEKIGKRSAWDGEGCVREKLGRKGGKRCEGKSGDPAGGFLKGGRQGWAIWGWGIREMVGGVRKGDREGRVFKRLPFKSEADDRPAVGRSWSESDKCSQDQLKDIYCYGTPS